MCVKRVFVYHYKKKVISIEEFLSSVYRKKSVQINANQSIITKKFNPIFREKGHHGLLRSHRDPTRHQGLSE